MNGYICQDYATNSIINNLIQKWIRLLYKLDNQYHVIKYLPKDSLSTK